jgi:hypothetical protein
VIIQRLQAGRRVGGSIGEAMRAFAVLLVTIGVFGGVGLGRSASARGTPAMWPYRVAPTRACLAATPFVHPQRTYLTGYSPARGVRYLAEIDWLRVAGTTDSIIITFARNPRGAAAVARLYRQLDVADGDTPAEARRYVLLKGNVVSFANVLDLHMTPWRRAVITNCLRPELDMGPGKG